MNQFNTYEAKRNFSSLLDRVQKGETVLIARHNKPIAELRPLVHKPQAPRPAGLCAGDFTVPENFNEPLPADILSAFEAS